MAIAFPTTASDISTASSASNSTMTLNKPPNTVTGDWLGLAFVFRNAAGTAITFTPSLGFTRADPNDFTNQTAGFGLRYVSNGGTEPSTYAVAVSGVGSSRCDAILFRITGAAAASVTDVIGAISGTTGTTTVVAPGVTSTVNGDGLIQICVGLNSTTSGPVFSAHSGSGMTLLNSTTVNNGASSIALGVLAKVLGSAGATGTVTADMSPAASSSQSWLVAIKPPTVPVAAFTSSPVGTDVNFTDNSTAASPATLTGWAWDFGDSTTSTSQNPTKHYAAAGTYTVQLTVTDSNSVTATVSHSVIVTAPGGTATVTGVGSVADSGWTAVGAADVTTALGDTVSSAPNLATFAVSSAGPSGQVLRRRLGPLAPPATGQAFGVTVWIDRINSSGGTFDALLYEGATLRSTVTGLAIADMTASGGAGDASSGTVSNTATTLITFPWTDVQNVTDWNQLDLALSVTVT